MRQSKADYINECLNMRKPDLVARLIELGELHAECESYEDKCTYSEYYDFVLAYGRFIYGKHEFDLAVDEACKL